MIPDSTQVKQERVLETEGWRERGVGEGGIEGARERGEKLGERERERREEREREMRDERERERRERERERQRQRDRDRDRDRDREIG